MGSGDKQCWSRAHEHCQPSHLPLPNPWLTTKFSHNRLPRLAHVYIVSIMLICGPDRHYMDNISIHTLPIYGPIPSHRDVPIRRVEAIYYVADGPQALHKLESRDANQGYQISQKTHSKTSSKYLPYIFQQRQTTMLPKDF